MHIPFEVRINRWQKEVETHRDQEASVTTLTTQGYGPNGIKLRPTLCRAGVEEISSNSRKRRIAYITDNKEGEHYPQNSKQRERRPVGRPR